MKFTIQKMKFADALGKVSKVTTGATTLPVLSGVLIKAQKNGSIEISATNLDIYITSTASGASVEEEGTVLIASASRLTAFLGVMPDGDVTVELKKGSGSTADYVRMISGSVRNKLAIMNAADWPQIAKVEDSAESMKIEIPAQSVASMLGSVRHAMSKDDTRRTLQSVLVMQSDAEVVDGQFSAVATDGKRLSVYDYEHADGTKKSAIMPNKLVDSVMDALRGCTNNVMMTSDGQQILIRDMGTKDNPESSWQVQGRLIDGQYPNWRQVMPKGYSNKITCGREELMNVIKCAAQGTSADANKYIMVKAEANLLAADANCEGFASHAEMTVKQSGEPVEVRLDPAFIIEALKSTVEDDVTVEYRDGFSPIIISDGQKFREVVMPLRIS